MRWVAPASRKECAVILFSSLMVASDLSVSLTLARNFQDPTVEFIQLTQNSHFASALPSLDSISLIAASPETSRAL
jgi:hypothetical protein